MFTLEATARQDMGKGASRRLRRSNGIPAIIYGGKSEPVSITCAHNKVVRALEEESFHSAVFNLETDGKGETVILKSLQRHPYKSIIMHMDFLRVSATETISKMVPLVFINEENAEGVKQGGRISHQMSEVEVTCKAKDLPAHIDVDLKNVQLEQILHLTDLVLPKGVSLAHAVEDKDHDLPVVSIHADKKSKDDEAAEGESSDAEA